MVIRNIHEAKSQLSRLIQQVIAGEEVIIAKSGEPLVQLIPYQKPQKTRRPGVLKGKIKFIGAFDAIDRSIEDWFYDESSQEEQQ